MKSQLGDLEGDLACKLQTSPAGQKGLLPPHCDDCVSVASVFTIAQEILSVVPETPYLKVSCQLASDMKSAARGHD